VAERLERLRSDHSVLGGAGSGLSDCKVLLGGLTASAEYVIWNSGDAERSASTRCRLGFHLSCRARLMVCANASVSIEKVLGGKVYTIDNLGNWCTTVGGRLATCSDTQYMQGA
jgi:hypothetical protein